MNAPTAPESGRSIWILAHNRTGDFGQMEHLAGALGWSFFIKKLVFRQPNVPFLARGLIDRRRSDPLQPPWPDLVLCGEARTSVIARHLKRKTGGAMKIVCLGRPAGSPAAFDLVLTTAQYKLPKLPQVVELSLPLAPDSAPPPLQGQGGAWMVGLPRPLIAVLVGGTSPPEWLDAAVAAKLARDVLAYACARGGTLLVSTSPRTDSAAASALARSITAPHRLHIWSEKGDNPYRHFLALADEIIVTSDSVSMVAEAIATGRPVSVYQLPQRRRWKHRLIDWLYEHSWKTMQTPLWIRPAKWLLDAGMIEVRPDRYALIDKLAIEGWLNWFGEGRRVSLTSSMNNTATALDCIRQLFSDGQNDRDAGTA